MLKKVLIALAALAVVFVGYVAMQPSEFRVVRSATVAAPTPDVFAQVNNFHNWQAWSPWAKLDPGAKATFGGPPAGPGAVFTWAGNDKIGEGRMTLTESHPTDLVKVKVEFVKPFEGTNTTEFTFKPQGDQTAVTWSMAGHNNFVAQGALSVHEHGQNDRPRYGKRPGAAQIGGGGGGQEVAGRSGHSAARGMFRRTRPRGAVAGRAFRALAPSALAENGPAARSVLKLSMICPASANS
jgi:hypothetical protein